MTFQSRAAGTRRDLRERTDLARETPFFGSDEEAARFYRIGIEPLLASLPPRLHYVDFGGGQGVLALVVRNALRASGFDVRATVVDANERYLADAQRCGLLTQLGDIQDVVLSGVDLATMRMVNHYNDESQQRAVAGAIHRSLAEGAPFVSQIETGSALVCDLHACIADLLARDSGAEPGYWWPTLDRYIALLEGAGFRDVTIVGGGPDLEMSLEEALADAWRRFNASRLSAAATGGPLAQGLEVQRDRVLADARRLVAETLAAADARAGASAAADGVARGRVRLTYPVLVARRSVAG